MAEHTRHSISIDRSSSFFRYHDGGAIKRSGTGVAISIAENSYELLMPGDMPGKDGQITVRRYELPVCQSSVTGIQLLPEELQAAANHESILSIQDHSSVNVCRVVCLAVIGTWFLDSDTAGNVAALTRELANIMATTKHNLVDELPTGFAMPSLDSGQVLELVVAPGNPHRLHESVYHAAPAPVTTNGHVGASKLFGRGNICDGNFSNAKEEIGQLLAQARGGKAVCITMTEGGKTLLFARRDTRILCFDPHKNLHSVGSGAGAILTTGTIGEELERVAAMTQFVHSVLRDREFRGLISVELWVEPVAADRVEHAQACSSCVRQALQAMGIAEQNADAQKGYLSVEEERRAVEAAAEGGAEVAVEAEAVRAAAEVKAEEECAAVAEEADAVRAAAEANAEEERAAVAGETETVRAAAEAKAKEERAAAAEGAAEHASATAKAEEERVASEKAEQERAAAAKDEGERAEPKRWSRNVLNA